MAAAEAGFVSRQTQGDAERGRKLLAEIRDGVASRARP
jgi:hypothetical protein